MNNYIGARFGKLKIIRFVEKRNYKPYYRCKCDCGNERIVCLYDLTSGHTTSCGCLAKENRIKANTKHGLSRTRQYRIWAHMLARCYCETDAKYYTYGGRGIEVCAEWKENFQNFYDWSIDNGYSDDLTIDRIDVNDNYSPENCKWSNAVEQSNNKTNTIYIVCFKNEIPLGELARLTGIRYLTLYNALIVNKKNAEIYLSERGITLNDFKR